MKQVTCILAVDGQPIHRQYFFAENDDECWKLTPGWIGQAMGYALSDEAYRDEARRRPKFDSITIKMTVTKPEGPEDWMELPKK